MKSFGQFLVDQKLISEEVLLECLLEQIATIPATCQLIKEKKLLTNQQILAALEAQSTRGLGFKEACKGLGVWTDALEAQIKKEILAIRPPLGNILLKRGQISLPSLTKALDEFLSNDQNLSPQA